jgi:hypothetical protein
MLLAAKFLFPKYRYPATSWRPVDCQIRPPHHSPSSRSSNSSAAKHSTSHQLPGTLLADCYFNHEFVMDGWFLEFQRSSTPQPLPKRNYAADCIHNIPLGGVGRQIHYIDTVNEVHEGGVESLNRKSHGFHAVARCTAGNGRGRTGSGLVQGSMKTRGPYIRRQYRGFIQLPN